MVMWLLNWATYLISKLIVIQVHVNEGILEGEVVMSKYGSPYFSFKGIPYAEPPIGDLRFMAPKPKTPWDGVRRAKEHGSKCYQYELFGNETLAPFGSEDCLYLNVYTPNIAPIKQLPVMVWIHGGGFTIGSGDDDEYGPEFLVRKDVVLVTLNYRLEVLGFLSLDTEDIPGNAGMKDQVAALRWVKENIKKFGGDPDSITIFGESAGGASASYHLVSPMSKGLFNRAILQSGTLTCWWPLTSNARDKALALAKELGCHSNDNKEISKCLKSQPAENLVAKKVEIMYAQLARGSPIVQFGVISEKHCSNSEKFFYGDPYDVLRSGIHEGVQFMNGYTEDEGVMHFAASDEPNKVFEDINKFIDYFVPEPYSTNTTLSTQIEIGKKFREFYLQDKVASKQTLDDLLKYFNMQLFGYGVISMQKIATKTNTNKNYLYKFTCKSELNVFTNFIGLGHLFDYRTMVSHADDLGYIFTTSHGRNIALQSTTFKMINQVTTLWTNFAKYGDPTPNNNLGVMWHPFTLENQEYLDIGEQLTPGTFPEKEDVEFWEKNFEEFLPTLVP